MVTYKSNKKWKALLVSVSLKDLESLPMHVEEALKKQMDSSDLKDWKNINIIDTHIISSTYQANRDATIIDMLVYIQTIAY